MRFSNAFAPAASRLACAANSFASFNLFFRKVFTSAQQILGHFGPQTASTLPGCGVVAGDLANHLSNDQAVNNGAHHHRESHIHDLTSGEGRDITETHGGEDLNKLVIQPPNLFFAHTQVLYIYICVCVFFIYLFIYLFMYLLIYLSICLIYMIYVGVCVCVLQIIYCRYAHLQPLTLFLRVPLLQSSCSKDKIHRMSPLIKGWAVQQHLLIDAHEATRQPGLQGISVEGCTKVPTACLRCVNGRKREFGRCWLRCHHVNSPDQPEERVQDCDHLKLEKTNQNPKITGLEKLNFLQFFWLILWLIPSLSNCILCLKLATHMEYYMYIL